MTGAVWPEGGPSAGPPPQTGGGRERCALANPAERKAVIMNSARRWRRVAAPLVLASSAMTLVPAQAQWATFELIPELPTNALHGVVIYAITPDGSAAVGFSNVGNYEAEACLWRRGLGTIGLGDYQTTNRESRAYTISDDGSIVAGQGWTGTVSRAFRWTSATG